MMRHILTSAALLLWGSSWILAQPDSPSPSMPIPHPATMLLREPAVYQHLKLPSKQVEDLDAVLTPIEQMLWRLRDVRGDRRQSEAEPLIRKLHEEASLVLTEEQYLRFQQLERQALGLHSFLLPEVKEELRLNKSQMEQIQTLLRRLDRGLRRTQSYVTNENQSLIQEVQLRSRAQQDVLALLWPNQRSSFKDLLGPTFNLSVVDQRACRAPELQEVSAWINSPPLTLRSLRGKVVVVHFYTYGCGNCIRNLPHYNRWQERFSSTEFQIIGIHRPEFSHERSIDLIRTKAAEAGIQYPVAVDNQSKNWDNWANRSWPTIYVIDKQGFVRLWWMGELNWNGTESEKHLADRIARLCKES